MNTTTITQAAESVRALLKLARQHCGGSQPAALVLLSAYDSYQFPLPLEELRRLDAENYRHAMNVIDISYRGINPVRMLREGERHFEALRQEWAHCRSRTSGAVA